MRLIDRDLLLSEIAKSREKNPHEDSKIRANHTIEHDHIAHLVLEQPAAYDVDKVVERLETDTEIAHKRYIDCNSNTPTVEYAIRGTQYQERRKCLNIVKSGGIE